MVFSANQEQNRNHDAAYERFPALSAGCMVLQQVLIGSLRFPALDAGYMFWQRVLISSFRYCIFVCCDWPDVIIVISSTKLDLNNFYNRPIQL